MREAVSSPLGDRIDGDGLDLLATPRCATVRGFSVHGDVHIPALDRLRLERLIRYVSRPAVSTERLSELPDGRLLYRLKRRWKNGTTEVVFDRTDRESSGRPTKSFGHTFA